MAITSRDILALLKENRSVRRFNQESRISSEALKSFVEAAVYCASGRNMQPLRYIIVNDAETCARIFPTLKWAGYLSDWDGPEEGERPAAYLIQLLDTALTESLLCDDGLQLEAITLTARAAGISSCIIKSFDTIEISKLFDIPDNLKPRYVVALGEAAEKVVIEPMKCGDVRYWRTPDDLFHVPKRSLEEIIYSK